MVRAVVFVLLVIVDSSHHVTCKTAFSPPSTSRIRQRSLVHAFEGGDGDARPFFAGDSHNDDASRQRRRRRSSNQAWFASTTSSPHLHDERRGISDTDARVLESILQEGKLDTNDVGEARRLLEGPRRVEEGVVGERNDDGNVDSSWDRRENKMMDRQGKYNSKFVGAVSDNAFWNSLKAKAVEILDSVSIYIENRIERDAGILAAVGIFAVDRIRRDVGRALPAASRAARTLLLSSNSTYAERLVDRPLFALPSERIVMEDRESINDDGSTPTEEIREVVTAIRDILSGRDVLLSSSSSSSRRRTVRSFAPAGTAQMAERQRLAYGARKTTVLRREREGIDRKLGRAIGSISDATWEFQREMQTDAGREAGYRSMSARRALATSATRLIEVGKEGGRRLLSSSRDGKRKNLLGGNSIGATFERSSRSIIVDVSPLEEEGMIAKVMEETRMDGYATDGLLSPKSFYEEKRRLVTSLESCLSQPSETWLTKDVVAQAVGSGISLDGSVLRKVIATMVTLRDQLQHEIDEIANERVDLTMECIQTDLRRMKQMVDSVASLAITAAGESAAGLLKEELEGFVLSDSLDDIIEIELERMEQLLADMVAAREEEMQRSRMQRHEEIAAEPVMAINQMSSVRNIRHNTDYSTEVEVLLAPACAAPSCENTFNQDGQVPSQTPSRVEVVSDTEYFEYKQQFKYAQTEVTGGEVDANNFDQENSTIDFVLRVIDVIFFIGEKLFFVILPDLVAVSVKVASRYDEAQMRGRRSDGWTQLKNIKKKR